MLGNRDHTELLSLSCRSLAGQSPFEGPRQPCILSPPPRMRTSGSSRRHCNRPGGLAAVDARRKSAPALSAFSDFRISDLRLWLRSDSLSGFSTRWAVGVALCRNSDFSCSDDGTDVESSSIATLLHRRRTKQGQVSETEASRSRSLTHDVSQRLVCLGTQTNRARDIATHDPSEIPHPWRSQLEI